MQTNRKKQQRKAYLIFWSVIITVFTIGMVVGIFLHGLCVSAVGETVESASVVEVSDKPISIGKCKLTAYCTGKCCCGKYADGLTATSTVATPGRTVAVDPKVIPLGSKVYINGNEYIAEDVGGSIKGNRVDILFPSHAEALAFGVQYAEVQYVK